MEHPYKIENDDVLLSFWPNECPFCHKHINPIDFGYSFERGILNLVFKCSFAFCKSLFIVKYTTSNEYQFHYDSISIGSIKTIEFSDEIESISPSFIKIYNEANFAEVNGLLEICGVGYRKALEFLIKDYLIKQNPENIENIKKKFLGRFIQEDVSDAKIKSVSQRAVWLGNDETHYVREWSEENLGNLKKLISLTTHWIEMEELTQSFEKTMTKK